MGHGTQDWADLVRKDAVYGGIDMAELAARLGSRCVYDRRGSIYYWDGFEGTVERFEGSLTAPGKLPVYSSVYALSGSQSVYLDGGATGQSLFKAWVGVLGSQQLGMELAIGHMGLGASFLFELHYLAQGILRKGAIKIAPNAITPTKVDITIEDEAGAWHTIAENLFFITAAQGFGHLKGVFDFATGYYVRLLYDAVEYDVRTYTLAVSAEAQCERTYTRIESNGFNAFRPGHLYIDNLLLTCNEP